MSGVAQILASLAGLLVLAITAEAWFKRNRPKTSLAEKFKPGYSDTQDPDKPELGMEATDMEVLRQSERGNQSAAALGARDFNFWTKKSHRKRRAAPPHDKDQTHD